MVTKVGTTKIRPTPPPVVAIQGQEAPVIQKLNRDGFDLMSSAQRRAQLGQPMRAEQGAAAPIRAVGGATAALLGASTVGDAERAKELFGSFDLTDAELRDVGAVDTHADGALAALPAGVRKSYQHYYNHCEAQDWATVSVSKHAMGEQMVWMVATRTDGSDNYMELFDAAGSPLASGRAIENDPRVWDRHFGAIREAVVYD